MNKSTAKRSNGRIAMTRELLKCAMLRLLSRTSFELISVSSLCREAGVGRATFYLHYDNLIDVISELAKDALSSTSDADTPAAGVDLPADKMRGMTDSEKPAPLMHLMSICRRIANSPKYRPLLDDPFVADYLFQDLFRADKATFVDVTSRNFAVTRRQAELLFRFIISGAFCVNRDIGWEKAEEWLDIQKILLDFLSGGFDALK